MSSLPQSLLNAERLDLKVLLRPGGDVPACLLRLASFDLGGTSLLERTQAVLDALLEDAPPDVEAGGDPADRPWWSAMPAAYVAALLQHVAVPLAGPSPRRPGGLPVSARRSAALAREVLRGWGVPFCVREHAVALIAAQAAPISLPTSGAPAEALLRLSCALDLRSLFRLGRAEALAAGDRRHVTRLAAFRDQAERLGVFGRPCPRPAADPQAGCTGIAEAAERHRARNALRYFQLVARMAEPDWQAERLRLEARRARGRLHLLVGPAGTGKSTWARKHLGDALPVSSDRVREELTGDAADQSQNYFVFQRCMDRVREGLREGRDVAFDATNCSQKLRFMPVQAARWSAAEIVSYFFDVGPERALERNGARGRVVPEHVIRRQFLLLEAPALYEADRHLVVDGEGRAFQYWPCATGPVAREESN